MEPLPGTMIGAGHSLEPYNHAGHDLCGFIEWHLKPDGELCGGAVSICAAHPNRNGASWNAMGSLEGGDLTLAPSLQCTTCPSHGFVHSGRWVDA